MPLINFPDIKSSSIEIEKIKCRKFASPVSILKEWKKKKSTKEVSKKSYRKNRQEIPRMATI